MFTGLVEWVGTLAAREAAASGSGRLRVTLPAPLPSPVTGESVAVNGACLTLTAVADAGRTLAFDVLAETFKRTNLGLLPLGAKVNVERSLPASGRLGGHIVQGHVDAVATVEAWARAGRDAVLTIAAPEELAPFFVEKGSVAIDGVSLTIAAVDAGRLSVHLIPTTLEATGLASRREGAPVNVETDIVGKYVVSYLSRMGRTDRPSAAPPPLTMARLAEAGW